MTELNAAWLISDVEELLDAGAVGLYEFIWTLRSADRAMAREAMTAVAMEAFHTLIRRPDVQLVWLVWPSGNDVGGPGPGAVRPEWFDDITDKPYPALEWV